MTSFGLIRLLYNIYKQDPLDIAAIERSGLLAVKIGQTFALRLDFLDAKRCAALTQLYRKTTPIPSEDSEALLTKQTTQAFRDAFLSIDTTPFASASVGQAHTARLQNGDDVVIKIIKGDFQKKFLQDIAHARRVIRTALFFYPTLARVADPLGILDHIKEYTINELNLLHEIEGQKKLIAHYEAYKDLFDLSSLAFPKIYENLSSEKMMVSQHLTGKTVDELLDSGDLSYEQLLEIFHVHGFYLFAIGEFHGDLHPGNMIIQDGKIYFIDTGAISTVSDRIRIGLFHFFEKLSQFDFEGSAYYLNQMAEKRIEGNDFDIFEKKFVTLYADFENATVSEVSLTQKMMHTIKLGVQSGMIFEKGMYGIIKSMMYLDGMVLRCNKDAILMKDMRQFLNEFTPFVKKK